MAFSLNKVQLIGRLGRDPETRFGQSNNVSITNFSLATDYSYKGKDGNWVNETTWHKVVSFNLSDGMKAYLKKGALTYVEGRITTREWTDKENIKRYTTEIITDRIIPLGARDASPEEQSYQAPAAEGDMSAGQTPDDDLPF
ncbi:MAG: single-stranded DNA-binding protein [Ignavibacteriaceae bacterium]|nr:single-stranded DNA-binding protein [Ignavibacteriaceae bacterium]